jgi:molybdenum cofactor synthesis domain-containing protein
MLSIGILTASDKGARGEREDLSGKMIHDTLKYVGKIKYHVIVPDNKEDLKREMIHMADELEIDLILTTGGTGFGPRDVTPEATLEVVERLAPGIPEAMRSKTLERTSRAILSRAVAGIRGQTLIINLPGSPKGVAECLEGVLPVLGHGLDVMKGTAGDCAK